MSQINHQFERVVSAIPGIPGKANEISISYKPVGYWNNETIRVYFEFQAGEHACAGSLVTSDGMSVIYSIRHATGSLTKNVDEITAAKNFSAAYIDAIAVADEIVQLIKDGVEFRNIAGILALREIPQDTLSASIGPNKVSIVLAEIGSGVVAGDNQLYATNFIAKEVLSAKYEDAFFTDRYASQNERNYWWLRNDLGLPIIR